MINLEAMEKRMATVNREAPRNIYTLILEVDTRALIAEVRRLQVKVKSLQWEHIAGRRETYDGTE